MARRPTDDSHSSRGFPRAKLERSAAVNPEAERRPTPFGFPRGTCHRRDGSEPERPTQDLQERLRRGDQALHNVLEGRTSAQSLTSNYGKLGCDQSIALVIRGEPTPPPATCLSSAQKNSSIQIYALRI